MLKTLYKPFRTNLQHDCFEFQQVIIFEAMKAIWNGQVLAESEAVLVYDGVYYFPPESIKSDFFNKSDTYTICSRKGKALYFNIAVNGQVNFDAAWYYPTLEGSDKKISNYIAFWKGVEFES